ncbi:MAG: trypsin-like peptidase domain-containing protein [Dehalococcoidia bacterium]|nr:trypsin-like peptidase domain-containing protein [Dehalococcoidia bacterium]
MARFRSVLLVVAGILLALAAMFVFQATRPPPQQLTQRDINAAVGRALASATPRPSYASQVYGIIQPSVVRVEALVPATEGKTGNALGAGVVIADDGTILTSLHIVRDASTVRVMFADGTESDASIVLSQPQNDLAVLRPNVIPDDLVPATLGSSATLRVGDEVFAVGNPFGISDSLSAGVVSGLRRSFRPINGDITLRNLIQFDAAANPGNSGGPLVDRNGEVVGIVTGLLNPTEDDVFIGIGFAVTIETAGAAGGAPPV